MHQLMLYLTQGLPAGGPAPLRGGTVFMSLPIVMNVEGNQVETEVRVTNDSPVRRAFSYAFVPGPNDGCPGDRRIRKVTKTVRPHATVFLGEVVHGRPGVLEIDAGPHFAITSQLIGTTIEGRRRLGPVMPLVRVGNEIPPGAAGKIRRSTPVAARHRAGTAR
ncbi:MAG: hypothetical protein GY856_15465 [bacterium]|nr:hypothetical protein [bacterium]